LVSNLRNVDVLFRIGEQRFASLLPETPPDGAGIAASRLEKQTPDITNQYDFDIELAIVHVGWGEEGAPAIDDVVTLISGPFEALRE
ncbi:hypothetical protein KAH43_07835, partial [Candidatus Bipolaricaulota bacterium]|nr:hypothetical protein [Candidatus Bipolaricaulota bacterium]